MTSQEPYSEPFLDATRAEADRLRLTAEQLRTEAAEHAARAEELTSKALAAEHRVRELDELLGRAPQLRLDLDPAGLRGQRLRDAAVEILARHRGLQTPIHYREWYDLVAEEIPQGVDAKDPLGTFLVQVTRSPVVVKVANEPGTYRLDPEAAGIHAASVVASAERAVLDAELAYSQVASKGDDQRRAAARRALDNARRRLRQAEGDLAAISQIQTQLSGVG